MGNDLTNTLENLFEVTKEGRLLNKRNRSPNARKGAEAGWLDKDGYRRVKVNRKQFLVHRLLFLLYNGYLPDVVDHIDGDTTNNRKENLREATKAENRWNCLGNKGSISGVKGVYFDRGRWKALVNHKGVRYYLGMYRTIETAKLVVEKKYKELHNEFYCEQSKKNDFGE